MRRQPNGQPYRAPEISPLELAKSWPHRRAYADNITDPRTGLPGKIKWPPQPAEVREACLDRANYLARLDEREERLARQRAEEKKFLDAKPAHPIERVNLILERHGFSPVNSVTEKGKRDRERATAELVALCEREGLDPKILDSIPDAN